jgi:hypothetical protein
MLNFRALRTPPSDGDLLIEPASHHLRASIEANRRQAPDWSGTLCGRTWAELRREARASLGVDPDRPIVLVGHQPEFMHAGVWAKTIAAQRFAEPVGGAAVNLVVDNDAPKSFDLRVPTASGGHVRVEDVPIVDAGLGLPYEGCPAIDPASLEGARKKVAALLGDAYGASAMPAWFEGVAAANAAGDFVDQAVAGRRRVERLFDVSLRDVRVSRVWGGPMLVDWLRRARPFAEAYNAALAEYRRAQGVRRPDRPIPDLQLERGRVELPLWAYGPGERRQRVFVEEVAGHVRLFAEQSCIGEIPATANADTAATILGNGCTKLIRPRALTLTLWARLLACDFFIHGIGGAKYDRITDTIIREYYRVEPPAFGCVSATLLMPLPRTPVTDEERFAAQRAVRDVRYQPERWASGLPEAGPQLEQRRAAIAESDRLRRTAPGRHDARRDVFERIRTLNDRILAGHPDVEQAARRALDALEHRRRQDRLAASREYFFALLPRDKLAGLCERLSAAACR